MKSSTEDIKLAVRQLNAGGIIAYPTESVYGFGCNPFNQTAIDKIFAIKRRPFDKGFILIVSHWEQVALLTAAVNPKQLACVRATWPGPVTWIFPAHPELPHWLTGETATIALRLTAHPIARQLCDAFGGPIVSTSANRSGEMPTRDYESTYLMFKEEVDFIVPGNVGDLTRPTPIFDVLTGEQLRF